MRHKCYISLSIIQIDIEMCIFILILPTFIKNRCTHHNFGQQCKLDRFLMWNLQIIQFDISLNHQWESCSDVDFAMGYHLLTSQHKNRPPTLNFFRFLSWPHHMGKLDRTAKHWYDEFLMRTAENRLTHKVQGYDTK